MKLLDASTLGKRIVYYRELQGLSQTQLAARLMIPRTCLSALESGHNLPGASRIQQLARALDCAAGDLFPPDWNPPPRRTSSAKRSPPGTHLALAACL